MKWCEHIGGLGPPFPLCAICEPLAPGDATPPLAERLTDEVLN